MKYDYNTVIKELNITEDVIAIIPYGSQVYGTALSNSDSDFIIITKGAFLKNGSFKNNAISNKDRSIQGVLYSRSGFINAIENYDISILECLSLGIDRYLYCDDFFIKLLVNKTFKYDKKEFVNKIIQKASSSFYLASEKNKIGYTDLAKKGVFHTLRILNFGLQYKKYGKIINFSEKNELYFQIKSIFPDDFDVRNYTKEFNNLINELRDVE